ncbi:TPA: hypothetical protein QCK47_004422 [Salmonella enterica subsp. enterica serovar Derby]|nr:hypothetical protein [Salmonella enterica subsp. enterica serovar Derby]
MKIENRKWEKAGYFIEGCKISSPCQVVIDVDGRAWRWTGSLPHVAMPDSLRNDGVGIGSWVYCYGEIPTQNNDEGILLFIAFIIILIMAFL